VSSRRASHHPPPLCLTSTFPLTTIRSRGITIRSSPSPHPIQPSRRRQSNRPPDATGEVVRAAGRRDDRSRQHVRGGGVLPEGQGTWRQTHHRVRSLHGPREAAWRRIHTSRTTTTIISSCWPQTSRDTRNLIKLVSKAYLEGFYYKPRMDKEILQQHHEGLIGLSGCLSGEVAYLIGQKDLAGATKAAGEISRDLRQGQLLSRTASQRVGNTSASPTTGCSTSTRNWASPSQAPTTATTSKKKTRARTTLCSACRPGKRSTIPTA
jgi:hypothetical protein